MILPSKKIIYIGIACAVAVGSISFAYSYQPKSEPLSPKAATLASLASNTLDNVPTYDVDSDNDGLKDWEETLWGTDANNADTDNDGTPDGSEIKNNRNPAVKGPKDELSVSAKAEIVETQDTEETGTRSAPTATQVLSQELFSQYMALKQADQQLTSDLQSEMIQSFLLRSKLAAPSRKIYLQTDFRINSDTSAETARAYGNTMGNIFKANAVNVRIGELAILDQALTSNSAEDLKHLDTLLGSYTKILTEMGAVRVPADIAETHAELATEFSNLITIVDGMKKTFSDPVITLSALDEYQTMATKMFEVFSNVNSYFNKKGISFSQSDAGYLFVNAVR